MADEKKAISKCRIFARENLDSKILKKITFLFQLFD